MIISSVDDANPSARDEFYRKLDSLVREGIENGIDPESVHQVWESDLMAGWQIHISRVDKRNNHRGEKDPPKR